jgi:succinoglycan biosynthesis transport protein ExoP
MNIEPDSKSLPGRKWRPFDPISFALRRGPATLAIAGGLFLASAPLAWILSKPYYQTNGSLIISPEVKQFLSRETSPVPGDFRDFAQTQARRILTDDVLIEALESIPREEWPAFISPKTDTQTAARTLRKRMVVEPVTRSHLIFVGMNAELPQGLAPAINATMEAFLRKLETEQESQSMRRLAYLRQEKEKVLAEVEDLKANRAEIAEQLKSATFNEYKNSYYDLLVGVQSDYVRSKSDRLVSQSLLDKAERNRTLLMDQNLDVFARDAVASNEAVYLIDNWTDQKLQELRTSIDGLTEGNTDRVYIEDRMRAMDEYLDNYKTDIYDGSLSILNEKREFELDAEVVKAKNAFDTATDLSEKLEEELRKANDLFQRTSHLIALGKELEADLDDLNDRLTLLEGRLAEVTLEAKAPVHLSVEERAMPPLGAAGDSRNKILAILFALTFGAVGGLILGHDLVDWRVRSPREIDAALGWPAPDPIPAFVSPAGRDCFGDCVRVFPDHNSARALRKLVVRLNQDRQKSGSRTFLFSGADRETGVSSIVRNVATAFTQYVNRVLIVTFDEPLSEMPDTPDDYEGNEAQWARTLLDCAKEVDSRFSHLNLTSEIPVTRHRSALLRLLEVCRGEFDAVLIDSPPVLSHDITQFLSLNVDAAVVVAREGKTQYGALRKSVEYFFRGRVPALTAVLNGASPQPLETITHWKDEVLRRIAPIMDRMKSLQPAPTETGSEAATQNGNSASQNAA